MVLTDQMCFSPYRDNISGDKLLCFTSKAVYSDPVCHFTVSGVPLHGIRCANSRYQVCRVFLLETVFKYYHTYRVKFLCHIKLNM
jgi:hypothetical protein